MRVQTRSLTPSHDAELEHVRGHVDVEDLDQGQVHVDSLQAHPGEGGQQEVVQGAGHAHTQAVHGPGGQPGVEQEHHIEGEQRQRQVDEDLGGVVTTQLPGRETGR